jgi:hypothetical protein
MRTYDTRKRVAIGNGDGFVTQFNSMRDQLLGMRSATEEAEIRRDL